MIKSYAIFSQKGGTGKTTTSLALAAGLARRGRKVLLVDVDQQEDSTIASGVEPEDVVFAVADVLNKVCTAKEAIVPTEFGYDILPSWGKALAALTVKPKTKVHFRKIIDEAKEDYDYIVVDCPPNIFGLTVQVLESVDEIVFPAHADSFSERALERAIEEIHAVRDGKNRKLSFGGILFNRHRPDYNATKFALPLFERLSTEYGIRIFETKIPDSTYVRESQLMKRPVYDVIDRDYNKAAPAFDAFVEELTGEKMKEAKNSNGKQDAGTAGSGREGAPANRQARKAGKRGSWNGKNGWK